MYFCETVYVIAAANDWATVGSEGINSCATIGLRNILEQQVSEGIVERRGCVTIVWDYISVRLA